jgi:hypothetical protein
MNIHNSISLFQMRPNAHGVGLSSLLRMNFGILEMFILIIMVFISIIMDIYTEN